MTVSELTLHYGLPLISRGPEGNGGIKVALFYDRENEEVFVYFNDTKTGENFVINPPKHLAADCYRHPVIYARAALNGINNPNRLNPAEMAA